MPGDGLRLGSLIHVTGPVEWSERVRILPCQNLVQLNILCFVPPLCACISEGRKEGVHHLLNEFFEAEMIRCVDFVSSLLSPHTLCQST